MWLMRFAQGVLILRHKRWAQPKAQTSLVLDEAPIIFWSVYLSLSLGTKLCYTRNLHDSTTAKESTFHIRTLKRRGDTAIYHIERFQVVRSVLVLPYSSRYISLVTYCFNEQVGCILSQKQPDKCSKSI